MKTNAEIIHSKDNTAYWDTLTAKLINLDYGTEKGKNGFERLPGLEAKVAELRDLNIDNELRFIELVHWLVQCAKRKTAGATGEAKASTREEADTAKQLLDNLIHRHLLGSELTKEERNHFNDCRTELVTQAELIRFSDMLHNQDKQKKTVGKLSKAVFSWHEVVNDKQQKEEKLFIDPLALQALQKRANDDSAKSSKHLQVNWLLIAAQAAIFIGNEEAAEVAIQELKKYVDKEKRNKVYWRVKTLKSILSQLRKGRENNKNYVFPPKKAKELALENSKGTYYQRAPGDPHRLSTGDYIFFTSLAVLALVFGVGVFVASHGGAALLFAPAGHALLSLLGVTTKVAADALAFSLLSLIPLSIFGISMETAFPRGRVGRFFSFIFKNKAANHKIQVLSPFYLNGGKFDKKVIYKPRPVTLWTALKERAIVTLLKLMFYPITYPVGIVLSIVEPEHQAVATSTKKEERDPLLANANANVKGKEPAPEASGDWDKFSELMGSKDKASGKGQLFNNIKKVYEEILGKAKKDPENFSEIRLKTEVSAALFDIRRQISKRKRSVEDGVQFFKPGSRAREALGYLNLQSHIKDEPKSSSSTSSSSTAQGTPHNIV